MLRKTVTLGSIIAALGTTSTLAHSGMFKSGFLAGAHVGIASGSGRFNTSLNPNNALIGASQSASGKSTKTAALFGVLGGYRHLFHDGFTLGLDVSLDAYSSNEINKNLVYTFGGFPPVTVKNKLKRTFGLIPSINIGKIFCGRWHVALGLGLGVSGFKSNVSTTVGSGSFSKTKVGFVPSVAVEYALTQNVSVVGKLGYEIYSKISKQFTQPGQVAGLVSTYSTSISPRYLTLSAGAVYRF